MLRKKNQEKKQRTMKNTYHLRWKKIGFQQFSRCNALSSQGWIQYNEENFRRKTIYSVVSQKEMKISGKRCIRCITLLLQS